MRLREARKIALNLGRAAKKRAHGRKMLTLTGRHILAKVVIIHLEERFLLAILADDAAVDAVGRTRGDAEGLAGKEAVGGGGNNLNHAVLFDKKHRVDTATIRTITLSLIRSSIIVRS